MFGFVKEKKNTEEYAIFELLNRGVDRVYPTKEALEQILRSGKKIKLYQGFDPTGDKLHLGHMVGLRKLAQWQALGHHVIFLIGDGTGQAGDPTGKMKTREKFFTQDELRKNATDYIKQASKIVRFDGNNPVEIRFNGDWLNKLSIPEFLEIAGYFSWQQLGERDLFQERIKKGETLNFREALYPLLQAYDSVAMDVDLELGGSDQTFNMLCGRTLMKSMKGKDKFVMTTPLIADKSGKKIGKSEGNAIALNDKPEDLFGKIMAFPDEVIVQCLECLTPTPMEEIKTISEGMETGVNPIIYKKRLAFEIVKELNDATSAQRAQDIFESTFSKGGVPDDVLEISVAHGTLLVDVLLSEKIVESKTEFRRLVGEGAITFMETEEKISDTTIDATHGVYKIGKRRFIKIKTL